MSRHACCANSRSALRSGVTPGYFESGGAKIFGCYHPPAGNTVRDSGVVVCQPAVHEYIWCHRACRMLAGQLAQVGFHVLRFDYRGSGDSDGESADARLQDWVEDVNAAADHLEQRFAVRQLNLVGLRLGATLAAMAGAGRRRVHRMVLWQPVVSGSDFLEQLDRAHRGYEEATGQRSETAFGKTDGEGVEALGFDLGQAMVEDLARLDLPQALTRAPAEHALLLANVEEDASVPHRDLRDRLQALAVRVEEQHCPDPKVWLAEPYKMFMPRRSINLIQTWFASQRP